MLQRSSGSSDARVFGCDGRGGGDGTADVVVRGGLELEEAGVVMLGWERVVST